MKYNKYLNYVELIEKSNLINELFANINELTDRTLYSDLFESNIKSDKPCYLIFCKRRP